MDAMVLAGLCAILLSVLMLPFCFRKVEHNLEIFLFVAGMTAALLSGRLSWDIGIEAIREPVPITLAVMGFGLLFKWLRRSLDKFIGIILNKVSITTFVFLLIVALGSIASVITAIIASLILVEIISMLRLDKRHETNIVIIACFSIGLGAALTPIGEPLSTIAIAKLRNLPDVNFWYLAKLLGHLIFGGIFGLAVISLFFRGKTSRDSLIAKPREETYLQIALRTGKVYIFVAALVLLGEGFKPVIDAYIVKLPSDTLFWINSISAVLDNATLTAAEISPLMTTIQIKMILMGLLLAGGMLIPGNIPNIISASKLNIKSKDWAILGIPIGLGLMVIFFIILKMSQ